VNEWGNDQGGIRPRKQRKPRGSSGKGNGTTVGMAVLFVALGLALVSPVVVLVVMKVAS
jgi:hypothetical protein